MTACPPRCADVFVTLHRQGLIYRDRRLVNWDPKLQTAISDLEVETREVKGILWHIRYPIEGEAGRFITVATTRPETMLGDTAVAVHPDDRPLPRLVGKRAILPLTGRRIPIVGDDYSDPEKGTGAVKITPAHDFNDFAVGQRHDLPMPSVLDRQARSRWPRSDAGAVPASPTRPSSARWTARRASPRAPPSSPSWSGWTCWRRSSRTPTRYRMATAAACRSSRC